MPTTATAPASAQAPSPAAEPSSAAPSASQVYTFPDGHLSFAYPAGWTVNTIERPFVKGHASGAKPVDAIVSDGTGSEVALIQSNTYAGGVSTDVERSFLDQAAIPGLTAPDGSALVFGFIQDTSDGATEYHAGVRQAKEFQPGFATSGSDYFELGNGMTVAKVILDSPAFASAAGARAWMGTEQYSELKKLFHSLKYSDRVPPDAPSGGAADRSPR